MPLGFRVIKPNRDPFGDALQLETKLRVALRNFGADAQRTFSKYPETETSYRRTGTLGRRWTTRGPSGTAEIKIVIGNRTRYAARVQGPKQEEQFKKRGWMSVIDVKEEVWEGKHKPLIRALIKGVTF